MYIQCPVFQIILSHFHEQNLNSLAMKFGSSVLNSQYSQERIVKRPVKLLVLVFKAPYQYIFMTHSQCPAVTSCPCQVGYLVCFEGGETSFGSSGSGLFQLNRRVVWASGFACKTGSQMLEGESACSAPNQGISRCFPRGLCTKVAHSVVQPSRLYPELSLPWSLAWWLLPLHPTQAHTECPELTSPEQQLYLSFHLWSLSFSPS